MLVADFIAVWIVYNLKSHMLMGGGVKKYRMLCYWISKTYNINCFELS